MSTRGGDEATLSEAVRAGLARDGGLYLPASWPTVTCPPGSLAEVAERVLAPFFADEALGAHLGALCRAALDFEAPVRWVDVSTGFLELFHGPTAAFKDVGARFLAGCMEALPRPAVTTVLVATSGDTGAAVGAAFHRRPGMKVVILYPDGRVSPRQAHHLGSFGDNVRTFRVQGTFDDCQRMVKEVLATGAAVHRYGLTSANSISLGRLLPQLAYYAAAAVEVRHRTGEDASFIIPAGNLGNALACLLARRVGMPIARVVLACNANRPVVELFDTGRYTPRPTVATLANAMDVGAPSNVERLLALFPDPRTVATAEAVSDAEIRGAIGHAFATWGVAVCPHTACAVELLRRRRARGEGSRWIVVATAHPAKFESVVEPVVGAVPLPPSLHAALGSDSRAEPLEPSAGALLHALG